MNKKYDNIHYWKNSSGYEVDFVLPDLFKSKNEYALIQVCYNFTDKKTLQREIRALVKSANEFKLKKALIITRDVWDTIQENNFFIDVKPYIQYVLE